ncbi:MAG: crossover junction endodeoxyribonuclease RuvC [Desulfobacteraceae bacterium]
MIRVVGIDPGLAGTGVGVVTGNGANVTGYAFGSIQTEKNQPVCRRLDTIYSKVTDFIIGQSPDLVIIEDIYSLEKYPGSGIMLGKVSGVLLLASYRSGAAVAEVAAKEAKKVVSASGNADKYQVERSVRHILHHGEKIRPFHASDALALALAGFFRYESYV